MSLNPPGIAAIGSMMLVFPSPLPRLDIIEAAGKAIPEGTSSAVTLILPFGADPNQNLKVQARSFKKLIPIQVVLTPDSGDPIVYTSQIDNSVTDPAFATVPVSVPANQRVTVSVWKR